MSGRVGLAAGSTRARATGRGPRIVASRPEGAMIRPDARMSRIRAARGGDAGQQRGRSPSASLRGSAEWAATGAAMEAASAREASAAVMPLRMVRNLRAPTS